MVTLQELTLQQSDGELYIRGRAVLDVVAAQLAAVGAGHVQGAVRDARVRDSGSVTLVGRY